MDALKQYILDRLKERSTYVGLITALSSIGVTIDPELSIVFATVAAGLIGFILTFTKDHNIPEAVKTAVDDAQKVETTNG